MSCGCKTTCNCDSSNNGGGIDAQVGSLQDSVTALTNALQPFLCGHPILCITDPNDILMFDENGKGSQCYTDWAFANGRTFTNSSGKNYTTVNLVDKFIVGAGGTYVNQSTGGAATVALTANQNGTHTHTVTDGGHTHVIVDGGHVHAVTDGGHTHVWTGNPHGHTLTIAGVGDHNHTYGGPVQTVNYTAGGSTTHANDLTNDNTGNAGAHTHTGTADNTTSTGTNTAAFTGVAVDSAFTGITNQSATTGITIANSGLGDAHENLPPYFACIYIQKI